VSLRYTNAVSCTPFPFFPFVLLKRKGRGTHHLFLEGIYPACCPHLHFLDFHTLLFVFIF
jgi:hypothetical protein